MNFTSKKVNYSLSVEILSIDLKKAENLENFSVEVKFAEKCMEIIPVGVLDERPASVAKSMRDPSQLKMSRTPTVANASKLIAEASGSVVDPIKSVSATKLYLSPNDADDERSTNSDDIRKMPKRGTARETTRAVREDDVCNDSTDESSANIQRKAKLDTTRETKISNSRQSKRETVREIKRETTVDGKLETKTSREQVKMQQAKTLPASFGSAEELFEITPNCMSGLLAKHCFKYEVLRDCQLYGKFFVFDD